MGLDRLTDSLAGAAVCSQAADINALFGFRIECIERLGDQAGIMTWTRLNNCFNWLPLAASIEERILCMHGGEHLADSSTSMRLCSMSVPVDMPPTQKCLALLKRLPPEKAVQKLARFAAEVPWLILSAI